MKTIFSLFVVCVMTKAAAFADNGAWLRDMLKEIDEKTRHQPVYARYTLIDITPVDPQRLALLQERVGTNSQHPLYHEFVFAKARQDGTAGWMCQTWLGDGAWRFSRDELNRPGDILDAGVNAKDVWVLTPPNLVLTSKGAPPSPERNYEVFRDDTIRDLRGLLTGGMFFVCHPDDTFEYMLLPSGRWRASGTKSIGRVDLRWQAEGRAPSSNSHYGTVEVVTAYNKHETVNAKPISFKSEGWREWGGGLWAASTLTEDDRSTGVTRRWKLLEMRHSSHNEVELVTKSPNLDGNEAVRGSIRLTGFDDFRGGATAHNRMDATGEFVNVIPKKRPPHDWLRYAGWCLLATLIAVLVAIKRRSS